jgi:hypothetical protein
VFKEADKKELIYHLLKVVCVGGAMCQAEEHFGEWKDMTKAMYKDLVNVSKKAGGSGIEIKSHAFLVDKWGESEVFKTKSIHNRFYVVADADYVNVLYKPFVNFW